MIGLVKRLAGIVVLLVLAPGLFDLIGSDWFDGAVSKGAEFLVSLVTAALKNV